MVKEIEGRALFWLDGHYSGVGTGKADTECPIIEELRAVASHTRNDHCLLIDDARCFGKEKDYPSVEFLRQTILQMNPGYSIAIENDIITVLPPN